MILSLLKLNIKPIESIQVILFKAVLNKPTDYILLTRLVFLS